MQTNKSLIRFCQIGYIFVGGIGILFPPLMPNIIAHFGLSVAAAGLAFPAKSVGALVGSMFAGVASDMFGRKPLLVGGSLLQTFSLILAIASGRSWPLFLLSFLLTGLAQGAISTTINALTADLWEENRAKGLNILHGVYGLGAMSAPLLIALVMGTGRDWRWVFAGISLIWLAYGAAALNFEYPQSQTAAGRKIINLTFLRTPLVASLFAIAFIYNGVAWVLLGWINLYLQESGHVSTFLATSMISLFYVGLTTGRFICAMVAGKLGYARTILGLSLGAAISFLFVLLGVHPLLLAVSVIGSGFFLSGIYPTALAYAGDRFPALAGTVVATLSFAMNLGTMIPPWWTGVIAEQSNFRIAVGINYLMFVPLLLIAWRLYTAQRETKVTVPDGRL